MRTWVSIALVAALLSGGRPRDALVLDHAGGGADPHSQLRDLSPDDPAALVPDRPGPPRRSALPLGKYLPSTGTTLSPLFFGRHLSPLGPAWRRLPLVAACHRSRGPPVTCAKAQAVG